MEGKSLDDLHRMRGEMTQMDLTQSSILQNVLNRLDDECLIIIDGSLDGTINYLESLIEPDMTQTSALIQLRRLQDCGNNLYTQMMIFFEREDLFIDFVTLCMGASDHLSLPVSSPKFSKEASLLDILLELINPPINLIIWQKSDEKSKTCHIIYQGGREGSPIIHMHHRIGLDSHYDLMVESEQSFSSDPSLLRQIRMEKSQESSGFLMPSKRLKSNSML